MKYNAHFFMHGFQELQGIAYEEKFGPVVNFTTVCLHFEIVATENFEPHQMDAKTVFLNDDLSEDLFMDQPESFINFDYPDCVKTVKCTAKT